MQATTFKCNALIGERQARQVNRAVDRSVAQFGNWIGGAVHLLPDRLVFSVNALNAGFQQDASDHVIPWSEITSCTIGRMLLVFRTVDLETRTGPIRLRCWGSANDALHAAINERMKG